MNTKKEKISYKDFYKSWKNLSPKKKREIGWGIIAFWVGWMMNHWVFAYRIVVENAYKKTFLDQIFYIADAIQIFPLVMKKVPLFSLHPKDLFYALCGVILIIGYAHYRERIRGKFRDKEEYGSARWGIAEEVTPFLDQENPYNNVILTETERLTMSYDTEPEYSRNKNIMVIGGSGTGKTYFFVEPNVLQMYGSYVITDPKGDLIYRVAKPLKDAGYDIRVLNLVNFHKTMHYNPFSYLNEEKDILTLARCMIENTAAAGEKEDFWVRAEQLLYQALIGYIFYESPEEEKNITTMIRMLDEITTDEDNPYFKNPIDVQFELLEEKTPEHFAVRQYHKFKKAADKTLQSILICAAVRLSSFDIKEVRDLMKYDEMSLDTLGERKCALFLITSDTDKTFNFIAAMLQTQLFNQLCYVADNKYGGKLPVPVMCILDEFANLGKIPNFEHLIAVIRSRHVSAAVILQSKSQLKIHYEKVADTIEDNCDTLLFLGGKSKETLKDLSELIGKETIDIRSSSSSAGKNGSSSVSRQRTGRALISMDELAVMEGKKCICQIRGVRPFFSNKYNTSNHPRYHLTGDFDKKNYFNLDAYLKHPHEWKVPKDQKVETFEVSFGSENEKK